MDGEKPTPIFDKIDKGLFLFGGHWPALGPVAIHQDRIKLGQSSGEEGLRGLLEVGQINSIITEVLFQHAIASDGIMSGVILCRSAKK